MRHGAQFAAEAHFADQHAIGAQRPVPDGGGDGRGHRQIGSGLSDAQAAHHVHEHILLAELESQAASKHRGDQQQAVEVDAVARAARVAEGSGAGEALHLYQQRAGAFHGDRDGGTRRVHHALGQESLGGVGHLHQAAAAHLEHAHFVSGAKAILHRPQQPKTLEAITFQIEHCVDHVL